MLIDVKIFSGNCADRQLSSAVRILQLEMDIPSAWYQSRTELNDIAGFFKIVNVTVRAVRK